MKPLAIVSVLAVLAAASPAMAENASSTTTPSHMSSADQQTAAKKIQQDLQQAGFSDVKVVAESFVVQAKTKDGNPVVMTIGPHGMSVFETMASNGSNSTSSSSSTTGSSTTGSTGNSSK